MKKLLVLTFCIIVSNFAIAQRVLIGAGVSFSRLDQVIYTGGQMPDVSKKSLVLNHSVSIGREMFEDRYFSFTTGLNLYRTGGTQYTNRVNIDYVSFNNTINFMPVNGKFKLQLQLGPRIDYILKNSLENTMPKRSKFNYGITSGVGAFYQFQKFQLGLNALYFGRDNILYDSQDYKTPDNYITYRPRIKIDDKFWLLNLSLGFRLNSEK